MAKKKSISKTQIIDYFIDNVLMHSTDPKSVYSFAKEHNFEEQEFYQHFGSFDALKQQIFVSFFDHAQQTIEKSETYQDFDARNKLLSFYFTFFEILTANRSYVVYALDRSKTKLNTLKILALLKVSFKHYIEKLGINTIDLKREELDEFQIKALKSSAWVQLLVTIKFWLEDSSPSFEKTDIFIEKSIKASFDVIDTKPLQSIIDFGKFILKETIKSK